VDTEDATDQTKCKQQNLAAGKTIAVGIGTQDDADANTAGTSRGGENVEDVKTEDTKPESAKKKQRRALGHCDIIGKNTEHAKLKDIKPKSVKEVGDKSQDPGKQKQKPPENKAETSKKKPKAEKGIHHTVLHRDRLRRVLGAVPVRFRRESRQTGTDFRRSLHGDVLAGVHQLRVEPVHVCVQFGRFSQRRGGYYQMSLLTYGQGWKIGGKYVFVQFWFFNQKNSNVQSLALCCLGIKFWYKFCTQIIRLLFLYYNLIFNLHEFTLPLASFT